MLLLTYCVGNLVNIIDLVLLLTYYVSNLDLLNFKIYLVLVFSVSNLVNISHYRFI